MDQNMMRVKCVRDLIGMLKDGNIYTFGALSGVHRAECSQEYNRQFAMVT